MSIQEAIDTEVEERVRAGVEVEASKYIVARDALAMAAIVHNNVSFLASYCANSGDETVIEVLQKLREATNKWRATAEKRMAPAEPPAEPEKP